MTNGSRIGSGLATSEPSTFYAGLWDHIRTHDIRGLDIVQGLFLEPHPILVGDALDVSRPGLPGPFAAVSNAVADARSLRRLARHLDDLERRQIVFTSAFLGSGGQPHGGRHADHSTFWRRAWRGATGLLRATPAITRCISLTPPVPWPPTTRAG